MNATYQAFANAGLLSRAADVDIASLPFAARSELAGMAGMAGIWNCTDAIELAEYFGVRTGKALALAILADRGAASRNVVSPFPHCDVREGFGKAMQLRVPLVGLSPDRFYESPAAGMEEAP